MIKVDWTQLKQFIDDHDLNFKYIEFDSYYIISAFDRNFNLQCVLQKTDPENSEQTDFEDNYKSNGNIKLEIPKDSDGSPLQRIKITTTGWSYQLHGVEFKTSQLDSIYSKDVNGNNLGFTNIKCYNDQDELLDEQSECDTSAVKTIIDWEPTYDYEIVGGLFKLKTIPDQDLRLWVVGVPDVPSIYGGSKEFVSSVNLKYIGIEEGIKADGRAPKYLQYNASLHTNKIRLVLTHPAGYKHDIHMILELFKP